MQRSLRGKKREQYYYRSMSALHVLATFTAAVSVSTSANFDGIIADVHARAKINREIKLAE
jgi:hypothetical protein